MIDNFNKYCSSVFTQKSLKKPPKLNLKAPVTKLEDIMMRYPSNLKALYLDHNSSND